AILTGSVDKSRRGAITQASAGPLGPVALSVQGGPASAPPVREYLFAKATPPVRRSRAVVRQPQCSLTSLGRRVVVPIAISATRPTNRIELLGSRGELCQMAQSGPI